LRNANQRASNIEESNVMSDRERIAVLEQELATLKEKVSPTPRLVAPVPDQVTVSFPRTFSIQMPTIEEFKKLLKIVSSAHPSLVPTFGIGDQSERQQFGNGFLGSFEIISGLKRTTTLDKRDASHWARNATLFLDARGDRVDVSVAAFMAAVVAAGDVPYSVGKYRCHVGLTYDGGAPATADGWRRVLSSGQVRPATHFDPQPRVARPSDVRIYSAG
jgi:hypothetical protein